MRKVCSVDWRCLKINPRGINRLGVYPTSTPRRASPVRKERKERDIKKRKK